MCPVKIKDIKGLMITETKNSNPKRVMPKFNRGFNEAIDLQGNREIGSNQKKLIKIISKFYMGSPKEIREVADAIISAEHELLEAK